MLSGWRRCVLAGSDVQLATFDVDGRRCPDRNSGRSPLLHTFTRQVGRHGLLRQYGCPENFSRGRVQRQHGTATLAALVLWVVGQDYAECGHWDEQAVTMLVTESTGVPVVVLAE